MKIIKKLTALLMVAAIMLSLCGCELRYTPNQEIPDSTAGKDIEKAKAADHVFSLNSYSKYSFNPIVATNHSNQLICALVYENMLEIDNDFNVIYNVITDAVCNEDGKTWTFTVDTNRTFHDGSQVTCNDLRMSLEYAINSDRYAGRFASIQGVSYGPDKLYVTLGIGNKNFVKLMNIPIIKVGTNGDKYPMGSGPYAYNEDYTELHAYEGYPDYDKLPVDTIYIKEYIDAEEIISAFEDSYIDVVINDPTSLTNLGYASSNETRTYATTNMHYVGFNEKSSTLGMYNNFRVAMQYAFDRDYLAETMLHGNGVASSVPMYPTCADYPTEHASNIDQDLGRCLTILENFGIRDYDEDGMLEYMNGTENLSLKFIVCSDSSAKTGMVKKFAEDMQSIGLTINVYELTWDDYLLALEEGEVEVSTNKKETWDMFYAETKLRNDFDVTELLQVRDKDNEGTNINYTGSTNTMYLDYINAYLNASDAERPHKYLDFCKYLSENATIIPLAFEKQQIITHRGVIKGVNANAGNPMYGFKDWIIDLS